MSGRHKNISDFPNPPFRGWGVLFFLLLPFVGCNTGGTKKLNRKLTVWRKDKLPYGTSVAYENLQYLFPEAEITLNKNSPSDLKSPVNVSTVSESNGAAKKAYIVIASRVLPDPA